MAILHLARELRDPTLLPERADILQFSLQVGIPWRSTLGFAVPTENHTSKGLCFDLQCYVFIGESDYWPGGMVKL